MGYQRGRVAKCDHAHGCDRQMILEPPTETQLARLKAAGWAVISDGDFSVYTFCPDHRPETT